MIEFTIDCRIVKPKQNVPRPHVWESVKPLWTLPTLGFLLAAFIPRDGKTHVMLHACSRICDADAAVGLLLKHA